MTTRPTGTVCLCFTDIEDPGGPRSVDTVTEYRDALRGVLAEDYWNPVIVVIEHGDQFESRTERFEVLP